MYILHIILLYMLLLLMYYLIFVEISHLRRILGEVSRLVRRMLRGRSRGTSGMLGEWIGLTVGLRTSRTLCSRLLGLRTYSSKRIIS